MVSPHFELGTMLAIFLSLKVVLDTEQRPVHLT
jgi:hypothetical protein